MKDGGLSLGLCQNPLDHSQGIKLQMKCAGHAPFACLSCIILN